MQALSLDYAIANSSGQGGLGHAGWACLKIVILCADAMKGAT